MNRHGRRYSPRCEEQRTIGEEQLDNTMDRLRKVLLQPSAKGMKDVCNAFQSILEGVAASRPSDIRYGDGVIAAELEVLLVERRAAIALVHDFRPHGGHKGAAVAKPLRRRNNRRIEGAQRRRMAEMAVRYPLEHPAHASVVQAEIELAEANVRAGTVDV